MGAPRRTHPLARRRRNDDDDDEEGSVAAEPEDDSLSEASLPSDAEDDAEADADAEGSEHSGPAPTRASAAATQAPELAQAQSSTQDNPETYVNGEPNASTQPAASTTPAFAAQLADTEAMLNGLKLAETSKDGSEAIDFEATQDQAAADQAGAHVSAAEPDPGAEAAPESLFARRRREHEEYRKKRDEDPAFVPNRGGFFMHDQRMSANGLHGMRGSARGRGGRGRGGGGGGPFQYGTSGATPASADAPWAHDLHDTVTEPSKRKSSPQHAQRSSQTMMPPPAPPTNRTFSRSMHIGTLSLRIWLLGMSRPVIKSAVPVHQHTRLPHHRPPLRRDRPVRVSLPDLPPRFVFPAADRSFVFIPREQRPNQGGYGRRGRGGSFSGHPSGRTSLYGGSVYSPSASLSRRSSMVREAGLPSGLVSPSGSVRSHQRISVMEGGKPVVRLPPPLEAHQPSPLPPTASFSPYAAGNMPIVNLPPPSTIMPMAPPPIPSAWPPPLPMHQPRPQKQVSVADIESPMQSELQTVQTPSQHPFHHQLSMNVAESQHVQQPFAQQISPGAGGVSYASQAFPQQVSMDASAALQPAPQPPLPQQPIPLNVLPQQSIALSARGSSLGHDMAGLSPSRRSSHASPQGTPLSAMAGSGLHDTPYQPYTYPPPPPQLSAFLPSSNAYPGAMYYYPPSAAPLSSASVATAPTFVPGQQYPYVMSAPGADPTASQTTTGVAPEMTSQPGTLAHESNGMVYYYDSSQLAGPPTAEDASTPYPSTMPFAPPEGYLIPQPAVFYPGS